MIARLLGIVFVTACMALAVSLLWFIWSPTITVVRAAITAAGLAVGSWMAAAALQSRPPE